MKNLLLIIFYSFPFYSFAQVHFTLAPEANTFYNTAMSAIKPEIKELIEKNAGKLKAGNIDTDSLSDKLKNEPSLKKLSQHDLVAIFVLTLVQASKNADTDLKNRVVNMRKNGDQHSTEGNGTEIILEYKSRIAENISLLMKKIASLQENVIENLK